MQVQIKEEEKNHDTCKLLEITRSLMTVIHTNMSLHCEALGLSEKAFIVSSIHVQYTSVYTGWRQRTWQITIWQSLPLPASDTYGPLAPGYCQYQGQGPRQG